MSQWRLLADAPEVYSYLERGPRVLLSDGRGIFVGHVGRYRDGKTYGNADGMSGSLEDWAITHWMPLPDLPTVPPIHGRAGR